MSDLLTLKDQMGRKVSFPSVPKRIVSLVPSQTEFLLDIGTNVVGRTKFCIHPRTRIEEIPVIGGTKNFQFDKIKALKPDLIVGNKEENYQEGIDRLSKDFPVWMSDIYTIKDSFGMMRGLGDICDRTAETAQIVSDCNTALDQVKGKFTGRVVYLIWKNPWMAAGRNTFIDDMLRFLGYENLVTADRYPELLDDTIALLNPEKILFSSEPYPFKEKHILEAKNKWPNAECLLVDGELHSWYGSRLRGWSSKPKS